MINEDREIELHPDDQDWKELLDYLDAMDVDDIRLYAMLSAATRILGESLGVEATSQTTTEINKGNLH